MSVKVSRLTDESLKFYFLLLSSFLIVAFGQSSWINWLSYPLAFLGYALFWKAISKIKSLSKQFGISLVWFSLVQSIALSWMTSIKYQGPYILIVYLILTLLLGMEFAFLSFLIFKNFSLRFTKMLVIASVWTIFEWTRLFVLSGFTWNPVGMALANNHFSIQLASVCGVYGLSFWVILVNLSALKAFSSGFSKKAYLIWILLGVFPYVFGFVHQEIQMSRFGEEKTFSAALVQTALFPEQKEPMLFDPQGFISPYIQWERIFSSLNDNLTDKVDFIVLPEVALPFGAYQTVYGFNLIKAIWETQFGKEASSFFPLLEEPYASKTEADGMTWGVSNAFLAQSISNYFGAETIIGFVDSDDNDKNYNAAFYFKPLSSSALRYEKRILVPMGEYIPFSFCRKIAARFGITDSFVPGKEAKVFSGSIPFAISICYEETYGNLMKEARRKGANLFINITNDVWFPFSKLPRQHFEHGMLRAVENWVPLIRACNTGITAGIDCFGRVVNVFGSSKKNSQEMSGILLVSVPSFNYATLYTLWGDKFIVFLSSGLIILFFILKKTANIFFK